MNDLLTAALTAASRGWHVFPLVPDAKRPAVEDWEHRATTDTARIERCWSSGPYGVGIACGPSRLVVVDLDQPKPGQTAPEAWRKPGLTCGADVLADRADAAGAVVSLEHPHRSDRTRWRAPVLRRAARDRAAEHASSARLADRHSRPRRVRRRCRLGGLPDAATAPRTTLPRPRCPSGSQRR